MDWQFKINKALFAGLQCGEGGGVEAVLLLLLGWVTRKEDLLVGWLFSWSYVLLVRMSWCIAFPFFGVSLLRGGGFCVWRCRHQSARSRGCLFKTWIQKWTKNNPSVMSIHTVLLLLSDMDPQGCDWVNESQSPHCSSLVMNHTLHKFVYKILLKFKLQVRATSLHRLLKSHRPWNAIWGSTSRIGSRERPSPHNNL